MITVRLYGLFRLESEKPVYQFEPVQDVAAVLSLLAKESRLGLKDWKKAVIYVNGTAIDKLSMFRTQLKDGDVLSVLSPASGG
jgi:molybdopterin converting factor small subunit